jgi:hypothetical protein
MIKPPEDLILTDAQIAARKKDMEDKLKTKVEEFKKAKEELMRKNGLIEVAVITMHQVLGIRPDSIIIPHQWKENETYIETVGSGKEKKDIKNNDKQNKKTK